MTFLSEKSEIAFSRPMMGLVIANTKLSTVPGVSAAGATPESTLSTPALDAEMIVQGSITSCDVKLASPDGLASPGTITRAMVELTGVTPVIISAGLAEHPAIPCIELYGECGGDPRNGPAVPDAQGLFERGVTLGKSLSGYSDLLVLGESVPGGTTTALCVLRALGYSAKVSGSFADNPVSLKETIAGEILERIKAEGITDPVAILRETGDPMMPAVAGIVKGYEGTIILAGGTQLLAVNAFLKAIGEKPAPIVTTTYVANDTSASFQATAAEIGCPVSWVDPDFGTIGHKGLARYPLGDVKEGAGAGGAMWLAATMGHSLEEVRSAIIDYLHRA